MNFLLFNVSLLLMFPLVISGFSPLIPSHTILFGNRFQTQVPSTTDGNLQSLSYAGAGAPQTDMNLYNVGLTKAASEWTAVVQAKTSMQDEGVFLSTRDSQGLFIDTLRFRVSRDGGFGILLTELAGGREDGLGITIVEGLVEGGNSEHSGILPGDSIVALTIVKTLSGGVNMKQERQDFTTECLGYDGTIEQIMSLPPPSENDEVVITVKRLRRKPKVMVNLLFPEESEEPDTKIELFAGENLRRALLTRGVKLNDPLSRRFDSGGSGDCGADGTCATCAVGVVKGQELLSPPKEQEKQIFVNHPTWRMACKTVVGHGMLEGEISLQVNPKQWI